MELSSPQDYLKKRSKEPKLPESELYSHHFTGSHTHIHRKGSDHMSWFWNQTTSSTTTHRAATDGVKVQQELHNYKCSEQYYGRLALQFLLLLVMFNVNTVK